MVEEIIKKFENAKTSFHGVARKDLVEVLQNIGHNPLDLLALRTNYASFVSDKMGVDPIDAYKEVDKHLLTLCSAIDYINGDMTHPENGDPVLDVNIAYNLAKKNDAQRGSLKQTYLNLTRFDPYQ
jgi:hypothetical protein